MSSKPPKKKYIDGLDKVTYDRYAQKTKDIGVDPYEVPKQKFNSDHKNLPAIVYIDILNYLVTSTSAYTYEQLRAFKSLDAYNQFVNGWVTDVKSLAANDKVLVTGRVRHSQRMNDTPLRPWVIASPSGIIDCAHCDCMAGLGEACTHVGALLFYSMEAYRLSKEKTVTQDKAYWLLPSSLDKVPYSEIRDIDFTTAETQKKQRDSVQNGGSVCKRNTLKLPEVPEPTADDISGFMEALFVTKSKASVLSVKSAYQEHFVPDVLKDGYLPSSFLNLREERYLQMEEDELRQRCQEIFDSLSVTEDQCRNAESITRDQSKSKEWHTLRIGRITSSHMKSVCTSSTETPAMSTLNAICGTTTFTNKATQWGCAHETTALNLYKAKMRESHENVTVDQCGLFLNTKYPHIGASPDAIVKCDCCGDGVVEVKCPYCVKDEVLTNVGRKLNFLCEGKLKENHRYFYQIQTQLLVAERQYCDFVVWTEKDCSVERVLPNAVIQEEITVKSKEYFIKVLLPELTGKLVSRERARRASNDNSDNVPTSSALTAMDTFSNSNQNLRAASEATVICLCQKPYDESEDVIGCDNENCKYVWLHFTCVNIKTVPRGAYYCPDCKPHQKKRKLQRKH